MVGKGYLEDSRSWPFRDCSAANSRRWEILVKPQSTNDRRVSFDDLPKIGLSEVSEIGYNSNVEYAGYEVITLWWTLMILNLTFAPPTSLPCLTSHLRDLHFCPCSKAVGARRKMV